MLFWYQLKTESTFFKSIQSPGTTQSKTWPHNAQTHVACNLPFEPMQVKTHVSCSPQMSDIWKKNQDRHKRKGRCYF